jgi:ADP-L-glycero-D-manno-heptose 6-epimerase
MTVKSFIVTGGCGFVGANLAAALLARFPGARVTVIDDFRTGSTLLLSEACARAGLHAFTGRVIPEGVERLNANDLLGSERPDAFFHLGAITDTTQADEQVMLRVNTEPFGPILRACADAGVPLVYASSAATYGAPPQARERSPFPLAAAGRPANVYGMSKWLMEAEHARVAAEHRQRTGRHPWVVGLRYFNVFGPGERLKGKMASMAFQLAAQLLAGQRPRLFVDGSQARDQVHVDDIVSCTLAAAGLGPRPDPVPGVYNAGSGVATSFNDVLAALRRALDIPESRLPTDYFEMPPAVRAFYQDWTCADLSETHAALGWKPAVTPTHAVESYGRFLRDGAGPGKPSTPAARHAEAKPLGPVTLPG